VKTTSLIYLLIGIVFLVLLMVTAGALYGYGFLYVILVLSSAMVSIFLVSFFEGYIKKGVEGEFGEKMILGEVGDIWYYLEFKIKRIRDILFFKW